MTGLRLFYFVFALFAADPSRENFYERLGVHSDDSHETIRAAYRKLMRENHPDRGGNTRAAQQYNEAYGVLGDKDKRAAYDRVKFNLRPKPQPRPPSAPPVVPRAAVVTTPEWAKLRPQTVTTPDWAQPRPQAVRPVQWPSAGEQCPAGTLGNALNDLKSK